MRNSPRRSNALFDLNYSQYVEQLRQMLDAPSVLGGLVAKSNKTFTCGDCGHNDPKGRGYCPKCFSRDIKVSEQKSQIDVPSWGCGTPVNAGRSFNFRIHVDRNMASSDETPF